MEVNQTGRFVVLGFLGQAQEAGLIPDYEVPTEVEVDIHMPSLQAVIVGEEQPCVNSSRKSPSQTLGLQPSRKQ
eukprot:5440894-Amphidinium_carterae.1